MNYLIEDQSQLDELALKIKKLCQIGGVVAVDTEFLREKTYNAKLCLVQLGIGNDQYCVDVLEIDDLQCLVDLFASDKVLKLFHAARQDMEVILQTLSVLPKPIFDTQLAAAFCGADMQIGYGALVQEVTGVELPKTQSRTDWTRRPLTADQVKYAGEDVAYLTALYENGVERLQQLNRTAWYQQEVDSLYDESLYIIDPDSAYQRLNGGSLKLKQQYLLKALANWREAQAQQRDIPRTWVIRDDKLYDVVQASIKTERDLHALNAFGRRSANYLVPEAFQIITNTKVESEKIWRKTEPLSKSQKAICTAMMKYLRVQAEQLDIAQALLATRKDVESLFRHRQSKKLLNGWRAERVGEPLIELIRNLESQA